jgi:hypothetical protein
MNVETKEQSKQWKPTHPPNKPKNVKIYLPARKLMAAVFWNWRGVLVVEFIQQETIIMSDVVCKTQKENYVGPFRTKDMECWHTV